MSWSVAGTVVGQGRYVLAEKLCEVCRLPPRTRASEHLALPEPSHRQAGFGVGTPSR